MRPDGGGQPELGGVQVGDGQEQEQEDHSHQRSILGVRISRRLEDD